ncbi:PspC domain-containing protein [Frigoriflavimonas asaccharolytica]|uniref:Phage shock protein PspC (Stress-responsive transcriptional regulator) n=1 Tax=Frigoriflavimonas asaccharolytica TaxID=2735899 RepID=A0A8J8G7D9_9FLAO|nr:PspC domain-containing protein [Frigoriflavimonas asaccharolytica]NRS92863.1 phage shock protein PspC (stress-responsive transcriptional regulator) [Frigoriflavimonas asaccharolytica]
MNKTLSIGLAGFSFTIEEHAYIKLSDYLAALRNSLDANEADEVMHDIEIRIVEIFNENLQKREVVNDADVEKVIAKIGAPEIIEEQEQAYYSENQTKQKSEEKQNRFNGERQLFRDPERQKIAGVCAGLAQYVGLDMTLMRAIWVIVFLIMIPASGSAVLILVLYAILWLVLPKAETASDFLKMKGKPVNFDNLKEESNKIVKFANESSQRVGEIYNENKPYINQTGKGIGTIFRYLVGAFFAFLGIGCLVGSAAIFGVSWLGNGSIDAPSNIGFFLEDYNLKFLAMGFAFLSTLIPAIIFFLISIKLLSPKTKLNYTGYVIGGLVFIWIGMLAAIGFTAAKYESQYSGKNEDTENIAINTTSDSLMVDVKKVAIPAQFESFWDNVYSDKKTVFKKDYPEIDVVRKEIEAPYLMIIKSADGYNQPLNLKVPVEISGNKIYFPNYMMYNYKDRMRDYNVRYELVVPKNMKVIGLNEGNGFYLDDESDDNEEKSNNNKDEKEVSYGNGIIKIKTDDFEYDSRNPDSIIVNGKKYPKEVSSDIIKKELQKSKNGDDVNINIKAGDKEVSIKTK